MSFLNIRRYGSEGVPGQLLKPGAITILGDPETLGRYAGKVYDAILKGIDIKSTFHHYDLGVKGEYQELADYLGANIICAIPNLVTGYTEVLATNAELEALGHGAVELMYESERLTQLYSEQILALYSLGAPADMQLLANIWYDLISKQRNRGNISFTGQCRPSAGIIPSRRTGAAGIIENRITERDILDVYESMPNRYSELYAKRNPEAAEILKFSLSMMEPNKNMVHLLLEAAKSDRGLLKKLHDTKLRIASQYGIKVKKWSKDQGGFYTDFYRYCLYFVDRNGEEKPIKFHNRPSYCIYMMYILDRFNRQDLVADLSFTENQKEFKKLYSEIMLEDPEKIESACNTMIHRHNVETGQRRKGRYDDYLKDIADTFDELVGSPDSMAFKVGHGQFLQIAPSNIEIDENLPKFSFI